MSIWFNPKVTAKELRPLGINTMGDHIGIAVAVQPEDAPSTVMSHLLHPSK